MNESPLLPPSHPLRGAIHDELHARFYEPMDPPARASWLALFSPRESIPEERERVAELCRHFGVDDSLPEENFVARDLGPLKMRWERHNEFSTWAFFLDGLAFDEPFADPVIGHLPPEWVRSLPGQTVAAIHLALEARAMPERSMEELAAIFAPNTFIGNGVAGGEAHVWTDFRIHEDGFARFLVRDFDLSRRQAGRLVQRLFEMETYRLMALLALPLARELMPEMNELEGRLNEINDQMTNLSAEGLEHTEQQEELLGNLSQLAADVERIGSYTSTRFHASRAYSSLVHKRIEALRVVRTPGLQTLPEYLGRRLDPGMQTCESQSERLESLSTRIHRTSSLLRTRVDVALERQNRDLLRSMNRRAHLQLRLQETVEGLSVVVISYYLSSLVAYILRGINDSAGLPIPVNVAIGLSVPVVVGGVWFILRRMRGRMMRTD